MDFMGEYAEFKGGSRERQTVWSLSASNVGGTAGTVVMTVTTTRNSFPDDGDRSVQTTSFEIDAKVLAALIEEHGRRV